MSIGESSWHLGKTPWRLFAPFVFRTTGFSFDALSRLRLNHSITHTEQIEAIDDRLHALREHFLETGFSRLLAAEEVKPGKRKTSIKRLYAIRTALIKSLPIPDEPLDALSNDAEGVEVGICQRLTEWNSTQMERRTLLAEAATTYATELHHLRQVLWSAIDDPLFQEAVFLSSPEASAGLIRRTPDLTIGFVDNSKNRAAERMAFSYLQRFCAKNDTASYFGPVNYGRFSPDCQFSLAFDKSLSVPWSRRRAFLAHWAVTALAQEIGKDAGVLIYLKPRRNPLVRVVDATAGQFFHHGAGKAFRLTGDSAAFVLAADGQTTVADLSAKLDIAMDVAIPIVRKLAELRLIDCALPMSSTTVDALSALDEAIMQLPEVAKQQAQPWVERAEQLRMAFEQAEWPVRRERFAEVETWAGELSEQARRKGGALYGDRLALYEDCAGDVQGFTVGGMLYQRIEATLPGLMEFLAGVAVLRRLDAQEQVRVHLANSTSRRYIDLVRHITGRVEAGSHLNAFYARLKPMIEAAETPEGIALTGADLVTALAPWQAQIDRELALFPLLLPSPDLMVAACSQAHIEAGDFELILAELHDDCSTVFAGFFAQFHPDPAQLSKLIDQYIRRQPRWQELATVLGGRRSKHVTPELPGTTVLLSGVSQKGEDEVVPICDIDIADENGRLTLTAKGKPLVLYPGDVDSLAHEAFSLPRVVPIDWLAVWGKTNMPRVSANGLVVQRASWELSAELLRTKEKKPFGFDDMRRLRAVLHQQNLPEWFFVRWSKTEKPILIDTRNPWSLDMLQKIATQAEQLRITEMCPGPETIFWNCGRGVQTFELRVALSRETRATVNGQEE